MYQVTVYTDGSCSGNGQETAVGGWAAIIRCNGAERVIRGYESRTTNNRMELRAVIEAVKFLKKPSEIAVYTDSQYICTGAAQMKKWLKQATPHANMDMWNELITEGRKGKHHLTFHHISGHSGNTLNDRCDAIARQQSQQNK